jgi:conjugative transfer signal peptidase TraF
LAALALFVLPRHLLVNWTPSLPVGLYAVNYSPLPAKGALVTACPPGPLAAEALARRYLTRGSCPAGTMPMLKSVVAVPGDRVAVELDGVWINGKLLAHSSPFKEDRAGRPLSATRFRGRIPEGSVWLYGNHPRSWDSRYFGPLPTTSITHTLDELLVLP